jgi:hypothetical protein
MDPYYAAAVCCCERIFNCRVSTDLHFDVLIKFITNGYDFKYKKNENIKGVQCKNKNVYIPQYRLRGVFMCCANPQRSCVDVCLRIFSCVLPYSSYLLILV